MAINPAKGKKIVEKLTADGEKISAAKSSPKPKKKEEEDDDF